MMGEYICSKIVKARKKHKCDLTGITIHPRQNYTKTIALDDDGKIYTYKTCEMAENLIHMLDMEFYDEWTYEEYDEKLFDYILKNNLLEYDDLDIYSRTELCYRHLNGLHIDANHGYKFIHHGDIWEVTCDGFIGERKTYNTDSEVITKHNLPVGTKIEMRYQYAWHFRDQEEIYYHASSLDILKHCKKIGKTHDSIWSKNANTLNDILTLELYQKVTS